MIYVVTYDDLASVKKFAFENDISLDLFPDVQNLLYAYRQISSGATEAGGVLIGYENSSTRNFTVSGATEPQVADSRSRMSLLLSKHHRKLINNLDSPYGYVGTWHTHPSVTPAPSSVDLRDWKKCIKQNRNSTSALVFVIAGTEAYRIWLYESASNRLFEGKIV